MYWTKAELYEHCKVDVDFGDDDAEREVLELIDGSIARKPIADTVYHCPTCRKEIQPTDNFCSYCGQPLDWSD